MSENKGTTRGKPKFMPSRGGGAVREIPERQVALTFETAFDVKASDELASDVAHHLRFRIVDVDNPPDGATKRQTEAVANAAKRLLKNLKDMPGSHELLQQIAWRNSNRPMDTRDLFRWLVFLQSPECFGETRSPATAYRGTIRTIAEACIKDGVTVSKTEGGRFLRFLEGIEAQWPGLIFPKGTIPQGRRDYLRQSLHE